MTFDKYRTKGAYHYDWYETEDWYKYLVDRCVKFCKGSTLDFGCGDGVLTQKLYDKSRIVYGYDPDPDAIKLAKDRVPGAYFYDKLLPMATYEYIASINVIEHMGEPELMKELIKDYHVKGAIITTIDYQGGALGEDHKFEWTYDEMMDFFKEFNPKGFRYKDTEWIGVEIRKEAEK